jgi:hypothetical protein
MSLLRPSIISSLQRGGPRPTLTLSAARRRRRRRRRKHLTVAC